jgi:hypothetical protein
MDLHIVGMLNDIQTAQLLGEARRVPSVFLTVLSDDGAIARKRCARRLVIERNGAQPRENFEAAK